MDLVINTIVFWTLRMIVVFHDDMTSQLVVIENMKSKEECETTAVLIEEDIRGKMLDGVVIRTPWVCLRHDDPVRSFEPAEEEEQRVQ